MRTRSPLPRSPSRRDLLRLGAAIPGLALLSRAHAGSGTERRFLFVLARGGWDTTFVFTPAMDNPLIATEADAQVMEIGGVSFVDHANRPAVRSFFEAWAPSLALVNGIEVRSVTHDRCKRILFTGTSASGADDWPSTIAARSTQNPLLPHLVVNGPAYTALHTDRVVRVGSDGQLRDLLDGEALVRSGVSLDRLSPDVDALIDVRVRERVTTWTAGSGHGAVVGNGYVGTLDTLAQMTEISGLSLAPVDAGCARDIAADAAAAFECFERGLSRCALVTDDGWCSSGWDTHSGNEVQAVHYELLFGYLSRLMEDLASRTSVTGGSLLDEVTVVVVSEMGRHPQLNATGGKDHWTYTSAMILGAGVRGGQVIGAMNADFQGRPVDLRSGEVTETGTGLLPGHLGATLLALADIDPASVDTDGALPIDALLA